MKVDLFREAILFNPLVKVKTWMYQNIIKSQLIDQDHVEEKLKPLNLLEQK